MVPAPFLCEQISKIGSSGSFYTSTALRPENHLLPWSAKPHLQAPQHMDSMPVFQLLKLDLFLFASFPVE